MAKRIKRYSATCPTCGYEHDFETKKAMDAEWDTWIMRIKTLTKRLLMKKTPDDISGQRQKL